MNSDPYACLFVCAYGYLPETLDEIAEVYSAWMMLREAGLDLLPEG